MVRQEADKKYFGRNSSRQDKYFGEYMYKFVIFVEMAAKMILLLESFLASTRGRSSPPAKDIHASNEKRIIEKHVLQGVTHHLESLNPNVRKFGMVCKAPPTKMIIIWS